MKIEKGKFEAAIKTLLRTKPIKRDDLRVRQRPQKAKSSR